MPLYDYTSQGLVLAIHTTNAVVDPSEKATGAWMQTSHFQHAHLHATEQVQKYTKKFQLHVHSTQKQQQLCVRTFDAHPPHISPQTIRQQQPGQEKHGQQHCKLGQGCACRNSINKLRVTDQWNAIVILPQLCYINNIIHA